VFSSLVLYGGYYGLLTLKNENGHTLLDVCNIFIGLLDKNGSEACSVIDWVFGSGLSMEIDYYGFTNL
jgi:hypothetical protein